MKNQSLKQERLGTRREFNQQLMTGLDNLQHISSLVQLQEQATGGVSQAPCSSGPVLGG